MAAGKGGQSIWGKPFADEVRSTLKVRTELLGGEGGDIAGGRAVLRKLDVLGGCLSGRGAGGGEGGMRSNRSPRQGGTRLELTHLPTQFNARGIVAMANSGPDTNKCVLLPLKTLVRS